MTQVRSVCNTYRLARAVHIIGICASMHMDVNKSGRDKSIARFDHFTLSAGRLFSIDPGNPVAFYGQICTREDRVRQDNVAVEANARRVVHCFQVRADTWEPDM